VWIYKKRNRVRSCGARSKWGVFVVKDLVVDISNFYSHSTRASSRTCRRRAPGGRVALLACVLVCVALLACICRGVPVLACTEHTWHAFRRGLLCVELCADKGRKVMGCRLVIQAQVRHCGAVWC
jgi:hypothetical protein